MAQKHIGKKGAKSKLLLRALLPVTSGACDAALTKNVYVQIRRTVPQDGDTALCAMVPASKFMPMKHMVSFWDLKHQVESACGIRDMAFTCKDDGVVRFYAAGSKVCLRALQAEGLKITIAFQGGNDASQNVCLSVDQAIKNPKGLGLKFP